MLDAVDPEIAIADPTPFDDATALLGPAAIGCPSPSAIKANDDRPKLNYDSVHPVL